jgi:hypothetical protein
MACIHAHHRELEEKLFTISVAIDTFSITLDELNIELAKCDCLCANCHAKEHAILRAETKAAKVLAKENSITV